MSSKTFFQVFSVVALLLSCGASEPEVTASGYDLRRPDMRTELPPILHEVSGITLTDENTLACVQDENGMIFLYDLATLSLTEQRQFNIDGDYEGITRAGTSLFVLRSDGDLFEIRDFNSGNATVVRHATGVPALNNEGLCYDKRNNRLLIGAKGKIGKGKEGKDKRAIYGFDLESRKLQEQPVFDLDLNEIKEFAIRSKVELRYKEKKDENEPVLRFATSELAIHPVSGELYVLSGNDHLLFIFGTNGKLRHISNLDPAIFNKSEGLAFQENGDMLVSNEGQDKTPSLMRFNYHRRR